MFNEDSPGTEIHELGSKCYYMGSEGHEQASKEDHSSLQLGFKVHHSSSICHARCLMGISLGAMNRAVSENFLSLRGPLRK